jgi:glycerol kinase
VKAYIAALDQGTTSCRTLIFDSAWNICSCIQQEFKQYYPQPGWVEHDPEEIWLTQFSTLERAIAEAGIEAAQIASIGITNQRETTVIWDIRTGQPIHNAIVWQDRRTAEICYDLQKNGHAEDIKHITGLMTDAYFSGTKIQWMLNQVQGARELAEAGYLKFGTIDSWLIWKLTQGKVHATDHSNASRTMLYDLHSGTWSPHMCNLLQVPLSMLAEIKDSNACYGHAQVQGMAIPIMGVAGDQQAALFGQQCFMPGEAKNTYGTGCFLLMNIGHQPIWSNHGLLTTIAWSINGKRTFALEGSIFIGGAVIQWLRDELHLIQHAEETADLAASVPDNGGVYFVPAFTGLGAPYWNMEARGMISGLSRGSKKAHIVRAALESIAYQNKDLIVAMEKDSGITLQGLKADGGATMNDWLMQFQSDILQSPIFRASTMESTALGAAMLAAGLTDSPTHSSGSMIPTFLPAMAADQSAQLYRNWLTEVTRLLQSGSPR